MNNMFRNYVTGTAFQVTLSRHQIASLQLIKLAAVGEYSKAHKYTANFTHLSALLRRGLIEWRGEDMASRSGPYITRAGELVLELLAEAGMGSESNDAVTSITAERHA